VNKEPGAEDRFKDITSEGRRTLRQEPTMVACWPVYTQPTRVAVADRCWSRGAGSAVSAATARPTSAHHLAGHESER
jgi:hypothetical protein